MLQELSMVEQRYQAVREVHVGRYLAGQSVTVTVEGGLLNVAHNGVIVATHARRHLQEDDERMDRRAKVTKPARPKATKSSAGSIRSSTR